MLEQPTGTVSLLFSDIEGSTALLRDLGPERYGALLARQRELFRAAFAANDGYEVDCEGDSFFVAFQTAGQAVAAAAKAQLLLAAEAWPAACAPRVRIGIHTGEPRPVPPKYVGLDVHEAARIMAAAHGGQVLVSETTAAVLEEQDGLVDLGRHRLKDVLEPVRLYQLEIEGLPSEFPPVSTLDARPTNLPSQQNPLIGRARELDELASILAAPDMRLLTLTGTGGVGKTRLALHLAAGQLDRFADGVFLVPLAAVRDADVVLPTIAQTLAARERPGEDIARTLIEHMRDRQLLLVLDNFEQLLPAARGLATLLEATAAVKVIVTSRARLQLRGEHIYRVSPLPLPEGSDLASVIRSEAAQLFAARAEATGDRFRITDGNAAALGELCRRLDGLPLALELAAARASLLTPQEILERVTSRLETLSSELRDVDERQRTMRATIGWSYELLDEPARRLFACLSVFDGGCSLAAAAAVADDDRSDVVDGLETLVGNSLLNRTAEPDAGSRFWLYQPVRQYAAEQLERDGREYDVHVRHAAHFVLFAAEVDRRLYGDEHLAWLRRIEVERENVRTAFAWLVDHDCTDEALRLWSSIRDAWRAHGHLHELRDWAERLIEQTSTLDTIERVELLQTAMELAAQQGEIETLRERAAEALDLSRRLGDRGATIGSLLYSAWCEQSNPPAAVALMDEAVELARPAEIPDADAFHALNNRAYYFMAAGQIEPAIRDADRALELAAGLGDTLIVQGQHTRAGIATRAGDYEQAIRLLGEARVRADALQSKSFDSAIHEQLALALLLHREVDRSEAEYRRALHLHRALGENAETGPCLLGLAAVAADTGLFDRAFTLRGAALTLMARTPQRLARQDHERVDERYLRPLFGVVAADARDRWEAQGAAMTTEQAVEYALAHTGEAGARLPQEATSEPAAGAGGRFEPHVG
jgi:predicted ATPase/class 3 adenylate cyclase